MKKYIIISVLTLLIFLSNCSRDMYHNTSNTPALFTEQLVNSFRHNHTLLLETLSINRAELIETLTKSDHQTAQKYSLKLIKLANSQNDFTLIKKNITKNFNTIKTNKLIDWKSIQLLNMKYTLRKNDTEMIGQLVVIDRQKQTDTIQFEAIKLQYIWYLLNLK